LKTINPHKLRQAFGYLKKQALSDACGVPPSNVSRWLSGGDIPLKHYKVIRQVTGMSYKELCEVDDDN